MDDYNSWAYSTNIPSATSPTTNQRAKRNHMMPQSLHLSNIVVNIFRTGVAIANKKGAMNKRTNKSVYVGC